MGARIIVADDSVTIQKVVELSLSREDVELIPARSGEEVMRKAQESRPDLMLIDHSMPDRSGSELCAALREDPRLRDVPIILMAGTFEPVDEAQVRQVGATDVVVKPFESQTLIEKVKQLLLTPAGPSAVPESAPPLAPEEELVLEGAASREAAPVVSETLPTFDLTEAAQEEPLELGVAEPLGESSFTVGFTETAREEPAAEVGGPEASVEALPTYELELSPGGMVEEVVQPSATPERQEWGIEDVAATAGMKASGAETVEAPAGEPAQAPEEAPGAEAVSGAQPLLVPPELIEALTREVAERVATRIVQDLKAELLDRVERMLWEVVPEVAEQLITQEIQRIRDLVEGKN